MLIVFGDLLHVYFLFLHLMQRNKPSLHEGLVSCLFRISGSVFTVMRRHKSLEPVKEAEVMNSYDSLCARFHHNVTAFNLLKVSRLMLTPALLQVQLFRSLRPGWNQHQHSSILHRSRKHRLAASNIHKYQWPDAGECKWFQHFSPFCARGGMWAGVNAHVTCWNF